MTLSASLSWLLILACVTTAQYTAASEWERQLWRRGSGGLLPYLKIGVLWGGLGVAFFMTLVFASSDPHLLRWMTGNGILLAFWATAIATAAWVAWSVVNRPGSILTRSANIAVVALLLNYAHPLLLWIEHGTWGVQDGHILTLILHVLMFTMVLNLGTLTLGYPNSSTLNSNTLLARLVGYPRLLFAAACLVLDVWLMGVQSHITAFSPANIRQSEPLSDWFSALAFTDGSADEIIALASIAAVFTLLVHMLIRQRLLVVHDTLAWTSDKRLPSDQSIALQNTGLIKKALGLTNAAVVFWHAPQSHKGIGTSDLRSGTTFISPGLLHDAGLVGVWRHPNLPDFWKAIIHPDDYPEAQAELDAIINGSAGDRFRGTCRFKALNGDWLTIRGELIVERSAINGLPISMYGVHFNITEETQANELLGATKARQLNALRMIGHDLQGSLGAMLMATSLIQRILKDQNQPLISKNLDRIRAAGDHALEFLGDAVAYARTEDRSSAGDPVKLNIAELLQGITDRQVQRYRVRPDKVLIDCPAGATLDNILEFPLTAALNNLVSNAIKYTPDPSGKVRITVRSLGPKTAPSLTSCTLIEIVDEGVGIPAAFIDRLFNAFSRADNVGRIEGSDLGLAIVANAIELLNAEISVRSMPELSRGSAFTLILPNPLTQAGDGATITPAASTAPVAPNRDIV